jgi:hypothetical protein
MPCTKSSIGVQSPRLNYGSQPGSGCEPFLSPRYLAGGIRSVARFEKLDDLALLLAGQIGAEAHMVDGYFELSRYTAAGAVSNSEVIGRIGFAGAGEAWRIR